MLLLVLIGEYMQNNELYNKFVKKEDYSLESIIEFELFALMKHKQLIRKTFKQLNSTLGNFENNEIIIHYIENYVNLLSIICDIVEFNEEEVIINKNRIKKSREAILAYANKYNNEKLFECANKLDEIVLDKNINVDDLITLIKKLIDKKEDINIIKKLLNTNKGAIILNHNVLFDYTFNLAMNSIKDNSENIYYYIALLKVFYSTTIDKNKYIDILNSITDDKNEFANEIYMILFGIKRGLKPDEILDKYGVLTNLKGQNIYLPNKKAKNGIIITIDEDKTKVRDDAISIIKDGNKTIIGIYITDVGSYVEPYSEIDKQALNNYKCLYLSNTSTRLFSSNIETSISLNKNRNRKVLALYVVFDENAKIEDYFLKEEVISVSDNLTYNSVDLILDNFKRCEIEHELKELYSIACSLDRKNIKKKEYWERKNKQTHQEVHKEHKSNKIVSEFMILYGHLLAKLMCENSSPFVYRTQNSSYIDSLVKKLNIKLDESTQKIIDNIYLPSRYSNIPLFHNGLNLDMYCHATDPSRRYSDLYNQYLVHKFYFNDKDFDFDYDEFLNYIEYFNQRNVELSLMRAEYSRALKIQKKS